MVQSILFAYGAAAVITAAYVHRVGVGTKPVSRHFGPEERVTLWVTSAAVGVLWLLFVPALMVVVFRRVRLNVESQRARWRVFLSGRPRHAGG